MDEEWCPPSIQAYTGPWTVDPWLSNRYRRCSLHSSVVMRAAALGLLYKHFRPFGDEAERSAYYKVAKKPDTNVRVLVFRTASILPLAFRRRLRREIVSEVRRLLAWLDRIENGSKLYAIEMEAFLEARYILDMATLPLQVDGSYARICGAFSVIDAEIKRRTAYAG